MVGGERCDVGGVIASRRGKNVGGPDHRRQWARARTVSAVSPVGGGLAPEARRAAGSDFQ